MISHILDKLEIESTDRPITGSTETTIIQCPYKIKDNMFIWDMPGLGGKPLLWTISFKILYIEGLRVSDEKQWDDFLKEYGTGHFDKTFLLCDGTEGINQMELYFLRHLIHNQRWV